MLKVSALIRNAETNVRSYRRQIEHEHQSLLNLLNEELTTLDDGQREEVLHRNVLMEKKVLEDQKFRMQYLGTSVF